MKYFIALALAVGAYVTLGSGEYSMNQDAWLLVLPASYLVVLFLLIRQ